MRSSLLRLVAERPGGALVAGLAVGDASQQSPLLAGRMKEAGLAHLTAVSGGNIAIVLLLTLGVARFLSGSLWLQVLVGGTAILGYALVVGPQPSLLRAALMGAVLVLSLLQGGPTAEDAKQPHDGEPHEGDVQGEAPPGAVPGVGA